jgi:hypothetical protein
MLTETYARNAATDEESPRSKALRLLCHILPERAREEFLTSESFRWHGKSGVYRIRKNGPTEIYRNGRLQAHACLQLTIPAPSYDRMIAEYLILNSNETLYLTKANVVEAEHGVGWITILLILANMALAARVIWQHWMF